MQPHLLERACVTKADLNVEFKHGVEEQYIRGIWAIVGKYLDEFEIRMSDEEEEYREEETEE